MSHNVSSLAAYCHGRTAWLAQSPAPLTRLMGSRDSLEIIGAGLLNAQMLEGRIQPCDADINDGSSSALIALMGSSQLWNGDLGSKSSTTERMATMPDDIQALAKTWVRLGCQPQRKCAFLNADALDLAMAGNAHLALDQWLDTVAWQERTLDGIPWLHFAARAGMVEMLEVLHGHGADLSQTDGSGNTPLFYASERECVAWLVAHGADRTAMNHQNMDTLSFWQVERGIGGARLADMKSALGRIPVVGAREDVIEQFLQIANSAAAGQVIKEARRLNILGHERNREGESLFDIALNRIESEMRYVDTGSATLTNARNLMIKVIQWPAAMAGVDPAALGRATCLAELAKLPNDAQASLQSVCQQRDLDRQQLLRQGLDGLSRSTINIGHANLERAVSKLLMVPGFFEREAATLVRLLDRISPARQGRMPDLTEALAAQAPDTAGWKQPGLLASLLRLSFPVVSGRGAPIDHARAGLRQVAEMASHNGAHWDDEALKVLATLMKGPDATHAQVFRAHCEQYRMEQKTAPAPERSAKPRRL